MYLDISEIKPSKDGAYQVKIVSSGGNEQREATATYANGTFDVEMHGDEFVKYWREQE